MGSNFANEGYAEHVEARLRSHAEVEVSDAQKEALKLIKSTEDTRGSLAQRDGATVLFSQGTCRVRSEEGRVLLQARADGEQARAHVEEVMTRHLREATGNHDLQVEWVREN